MVISYHKFGAKAVEVGASVLMRGGTALDAVERGIAAVEDDPEVKSVGVNGYPNWLGEVELDAGIMDGRTLRACGVAAVKRVRNLSLIHI